MNKNASLLVLVSLFQSTSLFGVGLDKQTYAKGYTYASFWAAQGTMPLLGYMGASKDQRDVLIVPIKWLHRTADIIVPNKIKDIPVNKLVTVERSANILAEELSLYWLKQHLKGKLLTSADNRITIRTVAAWRIVHKGFFKMIDKALETQGNVHSAVKAGTRAGLTEAMYVSLTQAVRNVPFLKSWRTYLQTALPDDAYPRTFAQHMTKLGVTIVAGAMLAYII